MLLFVFFENGKSIFFFPLHHQIDVDRKQERGRENQKGAIQKILFFLEQPTSDEWWLLVDGNVRKPLVMGNSIGSTYSDDINLRRRRSSSGQSIATTRESFSRTSNSARDSALVDPRTMVPRRQRRRITARRNDAVLLSLSRLIVETGRRTDWVDVSESWDEKKVETLVEAMLLAPRQQGLDEPCGEYQEECPICFYFYARVNRSSCCNKVRR